MPNLLEHSITIVLGLLALFIIIKTFTNLHFSWKKIRATKSKNLSGSSVGLYFTEFIRPVFFIKLFATCFYIVFISQYFLKITIDAHIPQEYASLLYALYQIILLLTILPSGYLVEIKHLKTVLIITTLLEVVVVFGYGMAHSFLELVFLQIAFGILKPIASSAEYAYVFRFSSHKTRAQSIALYTNTLRGAMIAGTFTGGLLVRNIGIRGTFIASGFVTLLALIYIIFYLPSIKVTRVAKIYRMQGNPVNFLKVLKKLPVAFKNPIFLRSVFLVGLPLGFLEEGALLFSLPLVLANYNIQRNIIAQLFVLFSIGFFITNKFIAKRSDLLKSERKYIFYGFVGFTFSLVLISLLHFYSWGIAAVALGLLLLGVSRGFVLSPAISSMSKSDVAAAVGKNVSLSVYKAFDTLGRIVGPIVLIQLLVALHYSAISYCVIACAFALVAVIIYFSAGMTKE